MALAWPDKYTLDLQLFINNSIVVVVVVVVVVLSFVFCFQVIWGGDSAIPKSSWRNPLPLLRWNGGE